MTVQEMHYKVDQKLQKVGSFIYQDYEPEEIDIRLNDAMYRFILSRMESFYNIQKKGLEETQQRIDDLRTIIKRNVQLTRNGDSFQLPPDYKYYVRFNAKIRVNPCGQADSESPLKTERIRPVESKHHDTKNPYFIHRHTDTTGTIQGNEITPKVHEKSILESVYLDYVREPQDINLSLNQQCELPKDTHFRIVDLAVEELLHEVESNRAQSNAARNKTIE